MLKLGPSGHEEGVDLCKGQDGAARVTAGPNITTNEFPATKRFRLVRRLGMGGMGIVFEVLDERDGSHVALKTLRAYTPGGLSRFKREFRSLQDLVHRNLVSLHELFEKDGAWFFTMEFVPGIDFMQHVRDQSAWLAETISVGGSPGYVSATDVTDRPSPARELWAASSSTPSVFDEPRLRSALAQLASGLSALHAAGKVHRDIKPANIRVAPDGRVVILDFGLISELEAREQSTEANVVGTAEYMAPEQAMSGRVGPEADWYAVGVLIYEALTGRLPFIGTPLQILVEKQKGAPAAPRAVAASVPSDLDALCRALLATDPKARPAGSDILRMLGGGNADAVARIGSASKPPFLGREAELTAVANALDNVRNGAVEVVCVHGDSGVGKTSIVREFVDRMPEGTVVLAGRCYEQETVPYKAFDGVVDALSRHLRSLPAAEAATHVPRHASLLVQAFPVLAAVDAFAQAPLPKRDVLDVFEIRTRAFLALRETLQLIAERHTLVVTIDDIQWADADSATLLAMLLGAPEPPSMLVLVTSRIRDVRLLSGIPTVRDIPVGPLDERTTRSPRGRADASSREATARRDRCSRGAGERGAAAPPRRTRPPRSRRP